MMSVILIIVLVIVSLLCWIFSTSTQVNGQHNRIAFVIKSIFYWIAVILSFSVGLFL